jgi:hypothetical protein
MPTLLSNEEFFIFIVVNVFQNIFLFEKILN